MKEKYNFDKVNCSYFLEENFTTDLCKLLHGVNLNFLKKKKNIVQTEFLQDEKAGVYKSHLSQNFYENFSNRLQSLYNKSKFGKFHLIFLRYFI